MYFTLGDEHKTYANKTRYFSKSGACVRLIRGEAVQVSINGQFDTIYIHYEENLNVGLAI